MRFDNLVGGRSRLLPRRGFGSRRGIWYRNTYPAEARSTLPRPSVESKGRPYRGGNNSDELKTDTSMQLPIFENTAPLEVALRARCASCPKILTLSCPNYRGETIRCSSATSAEFRLSGVGDLS